jgi:hypothetical protein
VPFPFAPPNHVTPYPVRFDYQDGANPYAGLLIEHGTAVVWVSHVHAMKLVFATVHRERLQLCTPKVKFCPYRLTWFRRHAQGSHSRSQGC